VFLLKNEYKNLSLIEHQNVIKVHDLYIDHGKGEVYGVMELFDGDELFCHLSSIGHYSGILSSR
jgi:serine/threonine protein kinase